jgi:hypothetical protein
MRPKTEGIMSSMLVTMSFDPTRADQVEQHLRAEVVTWAAKQPGFVSGRWLRSEDGTKEFGIVEFDSTAAGNAAALGPSRTVHDTTRAWNIDAVNVLGQLTEA